MTNNRPHPPRGFTLVEIMFVVAIIGLLAAIGLPNYIRARKRAQASRILNDLRIIDGAIDQYAIENKKMTGAGALWSDVQTYLKTGSALYSSGGIDVLGNAFGPFSVDTIPVVPAASFSALSDVAPAQFWSPYK